MTSKNTKERIKEETALRELIGRDWVEPRKGDKLGDYTLHTLIGQGGYAVVWDAIHGTRARKCAIKIFRPDKFRAGAERLEAAERFRGGANAMLVLGEKEPTIVTVLGVASQDEGYLWFAMELHHRDVATELQGDMILDRGQVIDDVIRAVTYAHTGPHISVHRDIRPRNILMRDSDGDNSHSVLTDFDLVYTRALAVKAESTCGVLGLEKYVPPEIWTIADPDELQTRMRDPQIDLYALSMTIFEIFCPNTLPLTRSKQDILKAMKDAARKRDADKTTTGVTPVSLMRRAARVCERGLANDPSARFPNIGALNRCWRRKNSQYFSVALTASAIIIMLTLAVVADFVWGTHGDSFSVRTVTSVYSMLVLSPVALAVVAVMAKSSRTHIVKAIRGLEDVLAGWKTWALVMGLFLSFVAVFFATRSPERIHEVRVWNAEGCTIKSRDETSELHLSDMGGKILTLPSFAYKIVCPKGKSADIRPMSKFSPDLRWESEKPAEVPSPPKIELSPSPVAGQEALGPKRELSLRGVKTLSERNIQLKLAKIGKSNSRTLKILDKLAAAVPETSLLGWERIAFSVRTKRGEKHRKALIAVYQEAKAALEDDDTIIANHALAGHVAIMLDKCDYGIKHLARASGQGRVLPILFADILRCIRAEEPDLGRLAVFSRIDGDESPVKDFPLSEKQKERLASHLYWVIENQRIIKNGRHAVVLNAIMAIDGMGIEWHTQRMIALSDLAKTTTICRELVFVGQEVKENGLSDVAVLLRDNPASSQCPEVNKYL